MSVTMPIEQKVAIARKFVTRVFNEHQPDRASEYFTADAVWHGGSLGTIAGRDNVVNLLRVFIGALPDLNAVEQDLIASGDLVAMRLVVTATHSADLLGIPASGRRVTWDAVDIYKVTDDGKISEEWALAIWLRSQASSGRYPFPGPALLDERPGALDGEFLE